MVEELLKRIARLEYHQQLFLQLLSNSNDRFTKLIIQKNLDQEEVLEFHRQCEGLSKKMEEQRAEGFVYFHPLLKEFSEMINKKLEVKETIEACLHQHLHSELMSELNKYVDD